MRFSKYGTVHGGVCDTMHGQRAGRERGALRYLGKLLDCSCFKIKDGKYKLVKDLSNYWGWRRVCRLMSANEEIGWHRFSQDVVPALLKDRRWWTWRQLRKFAKDIASFEFAVSMKTPLSIITPGEGVKMGYASPHQDAIYKQKKKDGNL